MTREQCPKCGGEKIISAEVAANHSYSSGFTLRPRLCVPTFSAANIGQWVGGGLSVCMSCGLAWTGVNPDALRACIVNHGGPLARQRLDAMERGPFRDLPDTDLAREIGSAVEEVDALAFAGSPTAIRRYRELSGATWDEALRDMRNWNSLERDEKLAMFGWASKKKKEAFDDFD